MSLSFGTFGVVVLYIRRTFRHAMGGPDLRLHPDRVAALQWLLRLLLGLWSAFGVVWLLGDLHLVSELAENVMWGICDYLAKVRACACAGVRVRVRVHALCVCVCAHA